MNRLRALRFKDFGNTMIESVNYFGAESLKLRTRNILNSLLAEIIISINSFIIVNIIILNSRIFIKLVIKYFT